MASEENVGQDSSSSSKSNETSGGAKRKRDDDNELDDQLSEDDFELIEENLGSKMKRKKTFVRVKRIVDDESDEEQERGRDVNSNQDGEDNEDEESQRKTQLIQQTDMPERMQLRNVLITSVEEGSTELDLEAEWIYEHAFSRASISNQDGTVDGREKVIKEPPKTIEKIRKALELIRNQHFEVPFISSYRKEYVLPELSVNNLWRVYKFDEEWTYLEKLKKTMMRHFDEAKKYQSKKLTQNLTESIPDNVRVLKDGDTDRLRMVKSIEELDDVYNHFALYYGDFVPPMLEEYRRSERKEAKDAHLHGPHHEFYFICARAGLDGMLKEYGLSPEQIAENMRDNYQRHEVDQTSKMPSEIALKYVSPKFPTAPGVLRAANYMLAVQIANEPLVRECVREFFFKCALIDVIPTKKGLEEINENHNVFPIKFLKDKPVRDLVGDQYLRLVVAEQHKLLTIVFQTQIEGATTARYIDEIKALFTCDGFSELVKKWNDLRNEIIEFALREFVLPALVNELKDKLLDEAQEFVMRACCQQLYNWLKVAPYEVDFDDKEDWDTKNGIRVMGLSYVADLDQESFCCLINVDGVCSNYIRLQNILKRKERDLATLRNFIISTKPHVIAVSAESREATVLVEDLRAITAQLVEDNQWPLINVELMDNSLAKVFAFSTRAETEFREYPQLLRVSISIARRLQNPLIEFSQLCNPDKEILCLTYHSMQKQLCQEELLKGLYLEFVNRTNEVGVDINRAINYPHTANLVQFICGLGPRKGQALMQILKENNLRLENRTQLVTACHMGPKVYINCAGFIKIDANSLGDSTESYVEVLDGSRVHPETYEWARKMAVDALEYDYEDANPAGAVEEILEAPERLKDLDLDAFADELERQGFGNKRITLYDIRSELNHRYKDGRSSYQQPSPEDIFNMVTKETPHTFFIGKLVLATVTDINRRKPNRQELNRANPNKNETTGLWQCPFCLQDNFNDWINVRIHLDKDGFGSCSGQAIGVHIRLENGLSGFLPIKCLSDSEVKTPEERFRPGQTIHCRITKINVEKFSVEATKDADCDTLAEEATVPVQTLPVPVPSAPSTSSRPNSSDRSRSPLPRAHSPISPAPVPAGLHNLVAAQPAIFVGNPVLWETRTRCQDYQKTGRCMRPRFLCPFTHGNVPSNDVRSRFFEIEQFYEAAGASSSHS